MEEKIKKIVTKMRKCKSKHKKVLKTPDYKVQICLQFYEFGTQHLIKKNAAQIHLLLALVIT